MIDTHVHLDHAQFDGNRDDVIRRAVGARLRALITMGTNLASSRRAIEIAEAHPAVYTAVAIHPNDAATFDENAADEVRAMAAHARVVAIGESGLDYYRDWCPRPAQQRAFRAHVRLSNELDKPVIVHNREAQDDVLAILAEENARRVVMHAFAGPTAFLSACVARGYWIAIGGVVTYPNADAVRAAAAAIPDDRLLIETDAPFLAPVPFRGRRNEPAYLPITLEAVAAARGATPQKIADLVTSNAQSCFGIILEN
ncbi:MAG: TatD family deoxyribonuclease [Armatimonadetes bacterium]|nr:TatD family deoxyribonuclease [Armatimonadota bacterium]